MAIRITSRNKLSEIMKDNEWHYVKTDSPCACSTCIRGVHLRLRKDGRVLSTTEEPCTDWYTVNNELSPRSPEAREFMQYLQSAVGVDILSKLAENHEVTQCKIDTKKNSPRSRTDSQAASDNESLADGEIDCEPHNVTFHQIQQAITRQPIRAPCECQSCSTLFWFSEKEQTSLITVDRETVIGDVRRWAKNATDKSQMLARGLKEHGATLRRRWARRYADNKAQRIKLINEVRVASAAKANSKETADTEVAYVTMNQPFGNNSRSRLLTLGLNPDNLLDDPESLFVQLEARSRHPSKIFYTDFHCVRSTTHHQNVIFPCFVPGAFNVTTSGYGAWQAWDDKEVHSFHAVAASVSHLVFESQSEIMDALWEIFNHLAYGLSLPTETSFQNPCEEKRKLLEPISIPTLTDHQCLYLRFPGREYSYEEIRDLCNLQLSRVTEELELLRQSRKAFNQRTNAAVSLQTAVNSCERFVPFQVLVEPHERVLWWLFIAEEAQSLVDAYRSSQENPSQAARLAVISRFKNLMYTVRIRSDLLLHTALLQGLEDAKKNTIVPTSMLKQWSNVNTFLDQFVFAEPTWKKRIIDQVALDGILKSVANSFHRVHCLIQDLSSEALLIGRIQEMLMVCEPTILLHHMEPLDQADHVRYSLYKSSFSSACKSKIGIRTDDLIRFFPPADTTVANSEAPPQLGDIWEINQQSSLRFYESEGFKPEWLEKVEDVWTRTDPGEVVEVEQKTRRVRRDGKVRAMPVFQTMIPHLKGEEKVSARTRTTKARKRLNLESSTQNAGPQLPAQVENRAQPTEVGEAPIRIPVCQASLRVTEALFSNAQVNIPSIRWQTFCNFMRDAGCEVSVSPSGGAGTRFVWRDPNGDKQGTITLHKPHPVPILEPQMLRNIHTSIKNTFRWRREDFVARKG